MLLERMILITANGDRLRVDSQLKGAFKMAGYLVVSFSKLGCMRKTRPISHTTPMLKRERERERERVKETETETERKIEILCSLSAIISCTINTSLESKWKLPNDSVQELKGLTNCLAK
jgi:hypothetical protein